MKILVIDDSRSVRKKVTQVLSKENYTIECAEDGKGGISCFEKNPPYDLITIDLDMPDMTGFDLCKHIRAYDDLKKSNTPIIILTGNDNIEVRKQGFEAGANNFLNKARVDAEIVQEVNRILRPNVQLKNLKALIQDSSRTCRLMLKHTLSEMNIDMIETNNGKEGLEH